MPDFLSVTPWSLGPLQVLPVKGHTCDLFKGIWCDDAKGDSGDWPYCPGTGRGQGGDLSVVHLPHPLLVSSKWTSAPSVISRVPKQAFSLHSSSIAYMDGASSFCKTLTPPNRMTWLVLPRWLALAPRPSARSCTWPLKAKIQQAPLPTLLRRNTLHSATFCTAHHRHALGTLASPSQNPTPRRGPSHSPWAL